MPSTTDWISKSLNSGKLTLNINKRSSWSSSKRERLWLLIPFNAAYPRSMIDDMTQWQAWFESEQQLDQTPHRIDEEKFQMHPIHMWNEIRTVANDACFRLCRASRNRADILSKANQMWLRVKPLIEEVDMLFARIDECRQNCMVFAKHTRNIVPRSRRYLRASQGLRARVDNNCVICEKVFATRGEVAMSINNVLRAKREKKSLQTPRGSKRNSFGKPL